MAEQTFRSPGFFEQEIDISANVQSPVGTPAGVVGLAQKGPAFVPVTVGSFSDFQSKFGSLEPNLFGPYAVNEWLKNKTALTYIRVLGGGSNMTTSDISNTENLGTVKNAGFKIATAASVNTNNIIGSVGSVQFIVARHDADNYEANAYPLFTDNKSINNASAMNLLRGVVFTTTGSRLLVMDNTGFYSQLGPSLGVMQGNVARVGSIGTNLPQTKYFKLVISSSTPSFGTSEGLSSIRILTASLDPSDSSYIGKILNRDPLRFSSEQHILYSDFSVEHDVAPVLSAGYETVGILSGSQNVSLTSGDTNQTFLEMFGRFDTRYTTARTTSFISQPFGKKEYDLFHFEALDDGEIGNKNYKVSIANLRASTNPANPYGTFEVQVRALGDTDTNMQILEAYPNCDLNPQSDRYVAKLVGDKKVYYDFDQENSSERRLIISGKYPNVSSKVRIVMNDAVERNEVPFNSLPFGFRGIPTLKTTDSLTDSSIMSLLSPAGIRYGTPSSRRLTFSSGTVETQGLLSSVVPPLPHRVKVTRGSTSTSGFLGLPGDNERVDGRFYWGVSTLRTPVSSSTDSNGVPNAILKSNEGSDFNEIINAYAKFSGIAKLDALVTGSAADEFNNNKFTLAKVATSQSGVGLQNIFASSVFTGSAEQIMLETAYIRNGIPNTSDYTISPTGESLTNRYTFASLIATSSILFNRFTPYAKFTNIFYGGFDGLDITDKDRFYFRDRALSSEAGGKANSSYSGPTSYSAGSGRLNNNVASINAAIDIMTDPFSTDVNLMAIPGVREPFVTDAALQKARTNGKLLYVLDLVKYDSNGNRLYDDSVAKPDPGKISEKMDSRATDNNYGATFFPDVNISDTVNNRIVKVPSSVAAMGVFGYNDKIKYPWFAPAGFNRGSLGFVKNVETRLTQEDRDTLYDSRINPIAVFPTGGFVVFGQKTLQQAKSSLDRINVRRLLIEVKRVVESVAQELLFEPNNDKTRTKLVSGVVPKLALIQAQQGIDSFKVVCDESNNSDLDVEANKMNGKIIIVPTRVIEFIALDFIVTKSGVQFI